MAQNWLVSRIGIGCEREVERRYVFVVLNEYKIVVKVRNFDNEASSINNRLWEIAGNHYRRLEDLPANKECK